MSRRATLRASDHDREQVAERLRNAAGEGRLGADELEERVAVALSAKTYGELEPLVSDLPAAPAPRHAAARISATSVVLILAVVVTLLAITGGALLGHGHLAHHAAFGSGPPLLSLIVVGIVLRMRLHRRHG